MYAKVHLYFWAPLRRWWLYRDLVQFGHNFKKTLLIAHDLPMIPMICLWSPVYLQGATVKMRKKFCTCENFSVLQKFRKSAQNQWKMQFFNTFLLKKKRVFHWAKTPKMHSNLIEFWWNFEKMSKLQGVKNAHRWLHMVRLTQRSTMSKGKCGFLKDLKG